MVKLLTNSVNSSSNPPTLPKNRKSSLTLGKMNPVAPKGDSKIPLYALKSTLIHSKLSQISKVALSRPEKPKRSTSESIQVLQFPEHQPKLSVCQLKYGMDNDDKSVQCDESVSSIPMLLLLKYEGVD